MTLQEIIEIGTTIILALGGSGGIVLGLSNYLGKLWADRGLEKLRQEHAQLNLTLQHNLSLVGEQTKAFLQIATNEHQIRFSKLHEERARIIADLYKQLVHRPVSPL